MGTFYPQKSKLNNSKMHKNACFEVNVYFSISLQMTVLFQHFYTISVQEIMCKAAQYL
jgi:hypothetical protein